MFRSEQEVLAEALVGQQAVLGQNLAQRRQVGEAHGRLENSGDGAAVGDLGRQPDRGDQAVGAGQAPAGDVEAGAVVGRGAHDRRGPG